MPYLCLFSSSIIYCFSIYIFYIKTLSSINVHAIFNISNVCSPLIFSCISNQFSIIASSKNGFHPDKQLIQIKRLCNIVINAKPEQIYLRLDHVLRRKHNDRNIRKSPETLHDSVAALHRQHEIQQTEIDVRRAFENRQPSYAICG